eukprot:1152579-Amphidinium_carterae.1
MVPRFRILRTTHFLTLRCHAIERARSHCPPAGLPRSRPMFSPRPNIFPTPHVPIGLGRVKAF